MASAMLSKGFAFSVGHANFYVIFLADEQPQMGVSTVERSF